MGDNAEFSEATEPFRHELLAHCYRLLGSVHDAEDAVQETCLRAWRAYGGFEGRSSLRTWLYQIATNRCLTALAKKSRRVLPSDLSPPEADPDVHLEDAGTQVTWLQPAPDASLFFGEVMGELFGLLAAGVLRPGRPTTHPLADGAAALADLEGRATVGRVALLP